MSERREVDPRAFAVAEPRSIEEAVAELAPDDDEARPLAGGTALMLLMKAGLLASKRLVSLNRIASQLHGIHEGDGQVSIGAMTTLREIEESPTIYRAAPILLSALRTLANVRTRNVATLGGHLAHADPHMDLPPVLLALGASVRAVGPLGSRSMGVDELILGYYETALAPNELLTEVVIPAQDASAVGAYVRFTGRSADDWPTLGVAVVCQRRGMRLEDVRIALSAVTDRPTRVAGAEKLITGATQITPSVLQAAADLTAAATTPFSDANGSAAFKREMVRVHVRRALERAVVS